MILVNHMTGAAMLVTTPSLASALGCLGLPGLDVPQRLLAVAVALACGAHSIICLYARRRPFVAVLMLLPSGRLAEVSTKTGELAPVALAHALWVGTGCVVLTLRDCRGRRRLFVSVHGADDGHRTLCVWLRCAQGGRGLQTGLSPRIDSGTRQRAPFLARLRGAPASAPGQDRPMPQAQNRSGEPE